MSVVDFPTDVVDLVPEVREAWDDNSIGRGCMVDGDSTLSLVETKMECPFCHELMVRLNIGDNRWGRIVAEVDEETALVDVVPSGMIILGCGTCDICFYSGETP